MCIYYSALSYFRCVNGFYGNPILGSGEHCRPCPCPGNPDSGHSNGASCHADHASSQILCQCGEGYAGKIVSLNQSFLILLSRFTDSVLLGPRCDRCAPLYYGDPELPGGTCQPCHCNGNIDPQDPESCDPQTGQCLKCLYYTDGHSCSECKPGYYGNALAQDCRCKYSDSKVSKPNCIYNEQWKWIYAFMCNPALCLVLQAVLV